MNSTPVLADQQRVLAIETSTVACSVAIQINGKIDLIKQEIPRTHNMVLLGMVHDLLRRNEISLSGLSAICFGRGPGSFTGTRIAAAVTQGLALPFNTRVLAISSLQALAVGANAAGSNCRGILTFIRSRKGEYYRGAYLIKNGLPIGLGNEDICQVDDLYPVLNEDCLVVFDELPDAYKKRRGDSLLVKRPDAAGLLGCLSLDSQDVDICSAVPVYLQGSSPWKKQNV